MSLRTPALAMLMVAVSCRSPASSQRAAGIKKLEASVPVDATHASDAPDGSSQPWVLVPAHVVDLPPVVEVTAEGVDTCARTETGEAWCWGSVFGAKPARNPTPGSVERIGSFHPFCVQIASTHQWTCQYVNVQGRWRVPITHGRQVVAIWPAEYVTLLALDNLGTLLRWNTPEGDVHGVSPADFGVDRMSGPLRNVSPNGYCAVKAGSGKVICDCDWNHSLGSYHLTRAECKSRDDVVEITKLHGATLVVASTGYDVCARLENGEIECDHNVPEGSLWKGTDVWVNLPALKRIGRIASFSSSKGNYLHSFTCALTEAGEVFCWGINEYGSLGVSEIPGVDVPVRIDVPKAVAVSLGGLSGCALTEDHRVYCWGDNRNGECGYGSYPGSDGPPKSTRSDAGGKHSAGASR
jgi:hypothetical protein